MEIRMAIPGQVVNSQISRPSPAESLAVDDFHSRHRGTSSFAEDSPKPSTNPADLVSTEKTRAALLQLGDSPRNALALAALWDENRSSIEHELHIHLYSDANSPLLKQLLARLVWHALFFCEEVDDPKAWVARCANLEARRLALQLREAR
jgi:hypothetical protein